MKLPWNVKPPKWWSGGTFLYQERRWSDQGGAGAFDRARRVALAVWPFVAMTSALMVAAAAVFAVVNIAEQRDRLVLAGQDAAAAAREAKVASDGNQRLLEQLKPCDPGDPPESAACQRDARMAAQVTAVVDRINEALAVGIAAHDLNTHMNHEELRRRLGVPASAQPAPIVSPPRNPARASQPSATAPPPPPEQAPPEPTTTTTTTCVPHKRERCR